MASPIESLKLKMMLVETLNPRVQIVTNFSLIRGEVVKISFLGIPSDYVILKESENNFIFIPFFSINSLIFDDEEGDL